MSVVGRFSWLLIALALGASLGGVGSASSSKTINCAAATAVSVGATVKYTQIRATDVGCTRAHQVLKAFAKGPTELSTYLGFVCRKSAASTANTFVVSCKQQQRAAISAHEISS